MLALSQYEAGRRIDPIYTQLVQVPRTLPFSRLFGARSLVRQMWKMGTTGFKDQPLRLFTFSTWRKGQGGQLPSGPPLVHCLALLSVIGDLPFASLAASRVLPSSSPV